MLSPCFWGLFCMGCFPSSDGLSGPFKDANQSELYGIPVMFIHGFRMSLFFFVSGFFTMMMWQKEDGQVCWFIGSSASFFPFSSLAC